MSRPVREYRAYGLRIRSALALPFDPLPEPVALHASEPPEVVVRLAPVPETLPAGPGHLVRTRFWQARPGAFLLHVEGVARYLVTGGREVSIEPLGGGDEDLGALFAGSPLTVLLQQRGVATLHAAAVATGAGAVLLLGTSGIGKSSLAAALVERGFALLADDVSGVVLEAGGRPVALPAFARLRLWAHTLDRMRWRGRAHSPVRRGMEKYWIAGLRSCRDRLPVCAAFVLQGGHRREVGIESMPPGDAFWALWRNTHRKRAMDAMGRRPENFRAVSALARRAPVARVTRPWHPFLLDALAERLAAHLRAAASSGGAGGAQAGASGAAERSGRLPGRRPPPLAHDGGRAAAEPRGTAGAGLSGPGIVWLASYPKSGSTWLRAVLTNYLREDGEPASVNALDGRPRNSRDLFNESLGLDSADLSDEEVARHLPRFREVLAEGLCAARPLPERRRRRNEPAFVKTHEAYRLPGAPARFPRAGAAGVVYLVRNPLDVAVSLAHHLNGTLDRAIDQWMNNPAAHDSQLPGGIFGRLPEPLTTWSGHVAGWTGQGDLPLYVARYEDLLADPRGGFGAIVRFAGLAWDGPRIERAVGHSAFPRLQAQEAESGFVEKQPTAPSFFRAGVAGSWRGALTPAQVRALVDAHGEVMERFGYLKEAQAFLHG